MLAGWMNRKQQLVIDYLLEENKVLREQLDIHANGKRLRYTAKQRRRLSDAGRKLGRQLLMQFATLVTPETIYAWHRKFVAMKYAPKNRDLSAAKERRAKRDALIIKIASENAGWGYGRIQGMMQHLGYHKISTSTIGEVLREAGIQPSPTRGRGVSWKEFVRIHAEQIAATDFFFVPVWTLKGLAMFRVHFVIDVFTRKVKITHIGCQYSGDLMVQIGRHLTDGFDGFLKGKKYLIHDRDTLFTEKFRNLLRSAGTTPWRLPIHMPMMNGYAECFVKTIKRECLDHVIFFSEDALRKTIAEYMVHYHMERPHQGIDNRIIEPEAQTYRNTGRIVKRARLGGLLNYYYRADNPRVGDGNGGKEEKAVA